MYEDLSVSELKLVDSYCRRFEAAICENRKVSFVEFLSEAPEKLRPALLCEMLTTECEDFSTEQLETQRKKYAEQLPEYRSVIDQVFENLLNQSKLNQNQSQRAGKNSDTRYRVLHRHASGGLGDVYLANDEELNRHVALKQIQQRHLRSSSSRIRFLLEAQVTGSLEHPGIVPVYGLGEYSDGRPYYAMRFIRGRSMDSDIDLFHKKSNQPVTDSTREVGAKVDNATIPTADVGNQSTNAYYAPIEQAQNLDSEQAAASDDQAFSLSSSVGRPVDQKNGHSPSEKDKSADTKSTTEKYFQFEMRNLLNRFIDVCQALAYAHSRGVLHRDIKPANIMLGEFGETFVVDWGLAKVQHDETSSRDDTAQPVVPSGSGDATEMGSVVGTLRYMSPEQADGRIQELDARSDVYSMGATLYHLLVGRPPEFGNDVSKTISNIVCGKFASPRQIQPSVPKQLDAICLKSMALDPDDRYQTASELAEDVERFLADEAVIACTDPMTVRIRRWLKKHQTLASVTAVGIGLLVVSLSIFSLVLGNKNSELAHLNGTLESTNINLDQKNEMLAIANDKAENARIVAQANEKIAKEQNELAFQSLTTVISDLDDALEGLPRGGALRRKLVETSLAGIQNVSNEYVEKSAINFETGVALTDMGDVLVDFGKDPNSDDELFAPYSDAVIDAETSGELSANQLAIRFYKRALEIFSELKDTQVFDLRLESSSALTTFRLGSAYQGLNEFNLATEQFNQAEQKFVGIIAQDSTNYLAQLNLASTYDSLGGIERNIGSVTKALDYARKAIELAREVAKTKPGPDTDDFLAGTLGNSAATLMVAGKSSEALKLLQECVAIFEKLVAANPLDGEKRSDLSYYRFRLGMSYDRAGDFKQANKQLEQTVSDLNLLVKQIPDNLTYQDTLRRANYQLGELNHRMNNHEKAHKHAIKTLEIATKLVEQDPANSLFQYGQFEALRFIGTTSSSLNKDDKAEDYFKSAAEIIGGLYKLHPNDPPTIEAYSTIFEARGTSYYFSKRYKDSLEQLKRSLTFRKKLAELDKSNQFHKWNVSTSLERIGMLQFGLELFDDALKSQQESLRIRQEVSASDPNDAQFRYSVIIAHSNVADCLQAGSKFLLAADEYEKVIKLSEQLIERKQMVEIAKDFIGSHRVQAARCRQCAVACGEWDELLKLPREKRPEMLVLRMVEFTRRYKFAESIQAARELRTMDEAKPEQLYQAAQLTCEALQFLSNEKNLSDQQKEQIKDWTNLAIETLDAAIKQGFTDIKSIEIDKQLSILRDDPRFMALIKAKTESKDD